MSATLRSVRLALVTRVAAEQTVAPDWLAQLTDAASRRHRQRLGLRGIPALVSGCSAWGVQVGGGLSLNPPRCGVGDRAGKGLVDQGECHRSSEAVQARGRGRGARSVSGSRSGIDLSNVAWQPFGTRPPRAADPGRPLPGIHWAANKLDMDRWGNGRLDLAAVEAKVGAGDLQPPVRVAGDVSRADGVMARHLDDRPGLSATTRPVRWRRGWSGGEVDDGGVVGVAFDGGDAVQNAGLGLVALAGATTWPMLALSRNRNSPALSLYTSNLAMITLRCCTVLVGATNLEAKSCQSGGDAASAWSTGRPVRDIWISP